MSNSYSNITLVTDRDSAIVAFLDDGKTTSYVYPESQFTCVFPKSNDLLFPAAMALSRQFSCVTFAVMVHDDTVLQYQLFRSGTLLDDYNSCPGYFTGQEKPAVGGNAEVLANAFDKSTAAKSLDEILRKSYAFELNRHDAICAKLETPYCTVGGGFKNIAENEFPEELIGSKLSLTCPDGSDEDSDFSSAVPELITTQTADSAMLNQINTADQILDEALKRAELGAEAYFQEVSDLNITGSTANGSVKIKSQGNLEICSVEINPQLVDLQNLDLLESSVLVALNDVYLQTTHKLTEIRKSVHKPEFALGSDFSFSADELK